VQLIAGQSVSDSCAVWCASLLRLDVIQYIDISIATIKVTHEVTGGGRPLPEQLNKQALKRAVTVTLPSVLPRGR